MSVLEWNTDISLVDKAVEYILAQPDGKEIHNPRWPTTTYANLFWLPPAH